VKISYKPLATAVAAITAAGALSALTATGAHASPAAPAAAKPKKPALSGDFNGDGRRDLVAPSPEGMVNKQGQAGFITVVYGGPKGLNPAKKQIISENSPGIPGTAKPVSGKAGDLFGMAVASTDFDRDGYADLAASINGLNGIVIIYGSARGLSSRTVFLKAKKAGWFGSQVTLGDFDGNGVTDVVTPSGSGFVTFKNVGKRAVTGVTTAVKGPGAYRSIKTAAGDFNGDKRSDLVTFVDAEGPDDDPVAMWAELRLGTKKGLGTKRNFGNGWAGWNLGLVGDLNGDHKTDLVVERASIDDSRTKGYNVLLGTKAGLGAPKPTNGPWIPRAVGDVNGDGKADVVGVDKHPDEVGNFKTVSVSVRAGNATGLSPKSGPSYTRKTFGFAEMPTFNSDTFADGLELADLTGDKRADLLLGFPRVGTGGQPQLGLVFVLRGTPAGVTLQGRQRLGSTQLGITGREQHDFGGSLLDY